MDNVRLGTIGLGNMCSVHAAQIAAGKIAYCELAAASDVDEARRQRFDARLCFTDAGALLGSGLVDAVLIATPHFAHVPLGLAALEAGLHVLVEKPAAVHKGSAISDGAAPGRWGSRVPLRVPLLLAARDRRRFNLSTPPP